MENRFEFVDLGVERREETVSTDANVRYDVPLGVKIERRPIKPARGISAPHVADANSILSKWNTYIPPEDERDVEAEQLGTINGGNLRRLRLGVDKVRETFTNKPEAKPNPRIVPKYGAKATPKLPAKSTVIMQTAKTNGKGQLNKPPKNASKSFKPAKLAKSTTSSQSSRSSKPLIPPKAPRPARATLNYTIEPPRHLAPGERLTHPVNDYFPSMIQVSIPQNCSGQNATEVSPCYARTTAATNGSGSDSGESCPALVDDNSSDEDDVVATLKEVDKLCTGLEIALDLPVNNQTAIRLNDLGASRSVNPVLAALELDYTWNRYAKVAVLAKDDNDNLFHGINFHHDCKEDVFCEMFVVPVNVQTLFMKMRRYFTGIDPLDPISYEDEAVIEYRTEERADKTEVVMKVNKVEKSAGVKDQRKSCVGGNLSTSKWAR